MNRSLGRTVGLVQRALDRPGSGAAEALLILRLDGYPSVRSFLSDLEDRTSPRWVYFESGLWNLPAAVEFCEEHGEQLVRETGATPGPDPWTWYRLACGCKVIPM